MLDYFKLSQSERLEVTKYKYEFYRVFMIFMSIMLALTSPLYFISDCQIFGRIAYETIIPRFIIYAYLIVYLILIKHCNNHYVVVIGSHLICHLIMWGTIWSVVYLPDKSHFSEGSIIFEIIILVMGLGSSLEISVLSQAMVVGNVIISNKFMHYDNYNLLISLGAPMCLGAILMHFALNHVFYTKYLVEKKLESLSYRDQLTNAYNRHKLSEHLEEIDISKCAFIIGDIDFFKKVNDTYGHDAGDDILKFVAHLFESNLPLNCSLYRWGGEEFLVLLDNASEQNAYILADKLRVLVANTDNSITSLTMSFGVATYFEDYKTTIARADKGLYYAKEHGRNQVVVYSSLNLD